MKSVRISNRPSGQIKEVEPVQPVQMNIYQTNTYRKELRWLHFNNEARVQEMQQVKYQLSYITLFVPYLAIPSSG